MREAVVEAVGDYTCRQMGTEVQAFSGPAEGFARCGQTASGVMSREGRMCGDELCSAQMSEAGYVAEFMGLFALRRVDDLVVHGIELATREFVDFSGTKKGTRCGIRRLRIVLRMTPSRRDFSI